VSPTYGIGVGTGLAMYGMCRRPMLAGDLCRRRSGPAIGAPGHRGCWMRFASSALHDVGRADKVCARRLAVTLAAPLDRIFGLAHKTSDRYPWDRRVQSARVTSGPEVEDRPYRPGSVPTEVGGPGACGRSFAYGWETPRSTGETVTKARGSLVGVG
jgi:hypothetical protein